MILFSCCLLENIRKPLKTNEKPHKQDHLYFEICTTQDVFIRCLSVFVLWHGAMLVECYSLVFPQRAVRCAPTFLWGETILLRYL